MAQLPASWPQRMLGHWVSRLLAHGLAALPLGFSLLAIISGELGPDPAETLVKDLGFAGACLLWLTLAITPLRRLSGWSAWMRYRRLLGLWAFAYLTLHLLAFIVLWSGLNLGVITDELVQRPYIYVGVVAWVLLVPLAVTSTQGWRRRLGRSWLTLHRLIYGVVALGLLHIVWISKLDYVQPALFALTLILLMVLRWWPPVRQNR